MSIARLVAIVLLLGSNLTASGLLLSAGAEEKDLKERKLTDAEIDELESATKDLAVDLIVAGIWKKNDDDHRLFVKYKADAFVPKPVIELKTLLPSNKVVKQNILITGAEYRHALVLNALFTPLNYVKLDDKAKRRANQEVFGQEEWPENATAAYKAGAEKIDRIRNAIRHIQGESFATASRQPESDATYRLVMESKLLDQDSKDLYKALRDRGMLDRLDEKMVRGWLEDPNKTYTDKTGKAKTFTSLRLFEDTLVIKAYVEKDKLTESQRKAAERILLRNSADENERPK